MYCFDAEETNQSVLDGPAAAWWKIKSCCWLSLWSCSPVVVNYLSWQQVRHFLGSLGRNSLSGSPTAAGQRPIFRSLWAFMKCKWWGKPACSCLVTPWAFLSFPLTIRENQIKSTALALSSWNCQWEWMSPSPNCRCVSVEMKWCWLRPCSSPNSVYQSETQAEQRFERKLNWTPSLIRTVWGEQCVRHLDAKVRLSLLKLGHTFNHCLIYCLSCSLSLLFFPGQTYLWRLAVFGSRGNRLWQSYAKITGKMVGG